MSLPPWMTLGDAETIDAGRPLPGLTTMPYVPAAGAEPVGYDNTDADAEWAWIQAAVARGNDVDLERGLEIDPRTGKVVGQMPAFYRTV